MKNKRIMKIFALVVALSMIFTTVIFAAPKHDKFDKKFVKDYEGALKSLIQKEIVKGYGNGDYGLSGNVKRGDVIVMIVRMLDQYGIIDQDDYDVDKLSKNYLKIFDDVDFRDYFYGHIKIANELGIAKGDGKYFKPNKPVTIQETIWLIERTGELLDIKFNSDNIDELEKIYAGDLKDFAKRRDVFWMLYLVLADLEIDDDDYDIADIKYNMDYDETFKFTDKIFLKAFGDEDLEYIKFTLPKDGTLYYNYDANSTKNTLVSESEKYYISNDDSDDELRISKITFKPKANFNGKVSIEYKAYDDDNKAYNGLIIITVNNDNELKDISHTMDYDEVFKFNDDLFLKAFDYDNEDLEYIKFTTLPTKGELLYNYGKSSEKPVELNEGYYIYNSDLGSKLRISNITYVPKDNFEGKVEIKYNAFDTDDNSYDGLIGITVERNEELADIKYTVKENNNLKFDYRSFDSYLDEVVFNLLDAKIGTLYFDDNNDGKLTDAEKIVKGEKITRSNLRYVYLVPYQDYKGEISISYIAYDGNEVFDGKVIVTVESVQEIPTLSFVRKIGDIEVVIDFEDNLYKSIGKELYEKLDYAKFTLPSKGQLMIQYNGSNYKSVDKNTEYRIDKIESIKYVFDGRGKLDINYTVFDEDTPISDKAYDGLITVEVTR